MKKYLFILLVPTLFACQNKSKEKAAEGYEDFLPIATTFFQPISSLELQEPDADKVNLF